VQKGRLSEAKGDLADAKKLYESSIAINPKHIKSLYRLVSEVVVAVVGVVDSSSSRLVVHGVSMKRHFFSFHNSV